jgi:hypothetical protein
LGLNRWEFRAQANFASQITLNGQINGQFCLAAHTGQLFFQTIKPCLKDGIVVRLRISATGKAIYQG